MGHNSIDKSELKHFVARIEQLEIDKAGIAGDIKGIYAEAKDTGYDPKILRKVIRIRKQDRAKREEEEAMLEIYMQALGMLADTPLGQASIKSASNAFR
jgi:uncharacterized protein (UPF0335 family)